MLRSRLAWAALAVAAALRVALGLRRPLQVDEAYSLYAAGLPLHVALANLVQVDVHPPLFALLTHVLYAAGLRDIGLRMLMVILGLASVWLTYVSVRLWYQEQAAALAALVAALMPSLIFYDTIIRMYALFDALALATFALLSLAYVRNDLSVNQRRAIWIAWTVLTALLWYTQYLGFMVTAAQVLYAGLVRRDGLARSLGGAASALLAFVPQLHAFGHQLPNGGLAFPFYAQHQLQAFGELAGQATIAVQTHGGGSWVVVASIVAWVWLLMDFAIALRVRRESLVLWLAAPAVLTLAYGALAHKVLYTDRYYLLLAYALCAWAGVAAWALLHCARWQRSRGFFVAAGAVLAVLALLYTFDRNFYTADWPAVAATIDRAAQPDDLVVLEQGSPWFVLQQHDLALQRGQQIHVRPWLPLFRRSSVAAALKLSRPFKRVWLVLYQSGPIDPDEVLLHALEARYPHARVSYFTRYLPAENVVVVLFQR